jgi:hypothetical protein
MYVKTGGRAGGWEEGKEEIKDGERKREENHS